MKKNWLAVITLIGFVALVFTIAWTSQVGRATPPIDAAALFDRNCTPCHGSNAEGTKIAPALTQLDNHTNEQLFQIISEGVVGTAMPVWKKKLSANEMHALVPYLRSLSTGAMNHAQPPAPPASVSNPAVQSKLAVALALNPSANGLVMARATVRDANEKPVANVPVTLNLLTALGGHLEVGSAKTDAQGVAMIEYRAGEGRNITLEANVGQGAQAVTTSAVAETPGGEVWTPAPLISPNPPVAEIAFLAVVLGGVWLTYAFVGRQLLGILRDV